MPGPNGKAKTKSTTMASGARRKRGGGGSAGAAEPTKREAQASSGARTKGKEKPARPRRTGRDLSLDDMKRKGTWAKKNYAREKLPPLQDTDGNPTDFALQAEEWGEPVPRTDLEARRIGHKGKLLLAEYRRRKKGQ